MQVAFHTGPNHTVNTVPQKTLQYWLWSMEQVTLQTASRDARLCCSKKILPTFWANSWLFPDDQNIGTTSCWCDVNTQGEICPVWHFGLQHKPLSWSTGTPGKTGQPTTLSLQWVPRTFQVLPTTTTTTYFVDFWLLIEIQTHLTATMECNAAVFAQLIVPLAQSTSSSWLEVGVQSHGRGNRAAAT